MTTEQIWELVTCDDPLGPLVGHLTERIWTAEALNAAAGASDLDSYLSRGEHATSAFERAVYDIYSDLYSLLEGPHERKQRVDDLFALDEFTLVIFDALSLREMPLVLETFAAAGLDAKADYALSCVPSDTSEFTYAHFHASGPSVITETLFSGGLAYRYVKTQDWTPDFTAADRKRLVWTLYPDDMFNLDHDAVSYDEHILRPVQRILESLLAADPVLPLVVTSDHGYIWQGGTAFWGVGADEGAVLSEHFKQGRCTNEATVELTTSTDKAWVSGPKAAARGRFAWGGKVKGPTKLFKHGGVSLMECVTPWVSTQ
ncbi:MAG: hypothetical protein AB7W28_08020 [Armatimonadota bacterium]